MMRAIVKSKTILVLFLSAIMLFPTESLVFAEMVNAEQTQMTEQAELDADAAERETGTVVGTEMGLAQESESGAETDTDDATDSDNDTTTDTEGIKRLKAAPLTAIETVGDIGAIDVVKGPTGNTAELIWNAYVGAAYYKLYSAEYDGGKEQRIDAVQEEIRPRMLISNLNGGTEYRFTLEAYDETDAKIAEGRAEFKTYAISFDESKFRTLSDRYASATKLRFNLRKKLNEGHGGYAVTQGACTDGTYAYYMMSSSSTQNGKVVKMRISDNKLIATSPKVLKTHHANGMTYDSKRNRLVAVGFKKWRHQLTYIDPVTLKQKGKANLNYPYTDMEAVSNGYSQNGVAAISYIEKYDVYLTRVRGDINRGAINDIMIFDAETLNMIGYVRTKITADYPETYQAMDADEKYVYFLLSAGRGQPNNIILALDWNAENILPVVNGEKEYIQNSWYCNNDGSGGADAVIRIGTSHEVEGLYHVTDSAGNSRFYVSEYYGRWKYKKVTKKVKYKKKWKKVRKRVKIKGKWKTKKVWKYKTAYKKKKVKVRDYWARDDYVYDIGVI